MSFKPVPYKQELLKRERDLIKRIKELDNWIDDAKAFTDEWWENYRKRNHLNVDLMTVKSRLKNLGRKAYTGIPIMNIDINQLK